MLWLRRFAIGVAAMLLLAAIAWLGLPQLLKWQLPLQASVALGRAVTIGEVSFKPWSLELTVDDLAVAGLPAASSDPLLRVKRIRADLSIATLFKRAPVVEALEIDSPALRIARTADGHYDIDDLIARFAPRADGPASDPARFALYNLQVRNAQLRFDDRPVQRVHLVEALQIALPFLSNLPAEVEVKVEPRLAFKLNGTPFDSGAQATPFAQNKSGALKLKMADLDLTPYLGYLPVTLPVRVTRGNVSADLALQFSLPQAGLSTVAVKGQVGAKDLVLTDARGQPLLAWQAMQLVLRDVQPLARKLGFASLRVDGLQLHAARDLAGDLNLLQIASSNRAAADASLGAGPVKAGPASEPAGAALAPKPALKTTSAPPWQTSLDDLELTGARVLWNDAAVTPAVALQADGLAFRAEQLRWPISNPMVVSLSGALRGQGQGQAPQAAAKLAEFAVTGPITDHDAKLDVTLAGLSLAPFAPYLAQVLAARVDGRLGVKAQLDWSDAAAAPRLRLAVEQATLDAFTLREGQGRNGQDALTLKQVALNNVVVDMQARDVVLGSVRIVQPVASVVRASDGRLNLQQWVVAAPASAAASTGPGAATSSSTAPKRGARSGMRKPAPALTAAAEAAWRLQVKDVLLEGGLVKVADAMAHPTPRGATEPLRFELTKLRVAMQDLAWQGERAMAPAEVQISGSIGAPKRDRATPSGGLDYKGRVGLLPLLANGKLRIARFPVHLFAPYFADRVKLTLLRAEAGYSGSFALRQLPSGLDVNASGDVLLTDVHIATLPDSAAPASVDNTDELLSWQALSLKAARLTLKPGARPQVEVGAIALNEFYSRLVVTEQGRFNLQEVAAVPEDAASAAGASALNAAPLATSAPAAVSATASAGLPLDLKLGITKLSNGRIDFTDRFIRPGYSAALTELNGQLGAFSSGSREMATLDLRGRAAGTALLEISGQLNPTVKPLALDIRAKASDLELAPLSPYAGKYAGYAIERGKLSMEVAYKIDADGKLDAKNQVVLNQLTFGDKIESKDATKLPVLLAVALLKDRNGVIDINLPVSGSLDDPKFSVGAIIIKVIVNLLTKAFTAPFALLAGGGSDDLSGVDFQPGTALMTAAGSGAVDKVAKALNDKPALKMTVTGAADPVSERDAFQQAALEARLVAERRREALRSGAPADAASAPEKLGADERARLMKLVYKGTDLPNKPRNAIGFAKDIPGPEMEALLKARSPVSDDAMRELALQRGLAVRDALIARGLPSERLFLAAPKLKAADGGAAVWMPQVQLALSVN